MNKENFTFSNLILFIKAFLWMLFFRLALLVLPFSKMAGFLSRKGKIDPRRGIEDARRVRGALAAVKRYTPWISNCWSQAAAGMALLRKQGIPCELFLGARLLSGNPVAAHAWLKYGDVFISGGKNHHEYAVVMIIKWGDVITHFPKQEMKSKQSREINERD